MASSKLLALGIHKLPNEISLLTADRSFSLGAVPVRAVRLALCDMAVKFDEFTTIGFNLTVTRESSAFAFEWEVTFLELQPRKRECEAACLYDDSPGELHWDRHLYATRRYSADDSKIADSLFQFYSRLNNFTALSVALELDDKSLHKCLYETRSVKSVTGYRTMTLSQPVKDGPFHFDMKLEGMDGLAWRFDREERPINLPKTGNVNVAVFTSITL